MAHSSVISTTLGINVMAVCPNWVIWTDEMKRKTSVSSVLRFGTGLPRGIQNSRSWNKVYV